MNIKFVKYRVRILQKKQRDAAPFSRFFDLHRQGKTNKGNTHGMFLLTRLIFPFRSAPLQQCDRQAPSKRGNKCGQPQR